MHAQKPTNPDLEVNVLLLRRHAEHSVPPQTVDPCGLYSAISIINCLLFDFYSFVKDVSIIFAKSILPTGLAKYFFDVALLERSQCKNF